MKKILIANRGEIAARIIESCKRLGFSTVAVFSEADRTSPHLELADEACLIGPAPVEESYLSTEQLLRAAAVAGADAVHPGYGFLSESPAFAEAVEAAGLTWIGPSVEALESMGSKIRAREIAKEQGVPVIPAMTLLADADFDAEKIVAAIGLPLLIKSSAGGGGIGMREVHAAQDLAQAIGDAREQSQRQFHNADLLLEKLISRGRHIEVQVVADHHGKFLHLYERDCSAQRRRQKILEEAPARDIPEDLLQALRDSALKLAKAVDYCGVGTVEFLLEGKDYYLLEMNTRLQVEHGVTEAVCQLDLVELQLIIAGGEALPFDQKDISIIGHAIEARIYAEDPTAGFTPSTGTITAYNPGNRTGLRIDAGVAAGNCVEHYYDGLLCKLIITAKDRQAATTQLRLAISELQLAGVKTNQQFLCAVLDSLQWQQQLSTTAIESDLEGLTQVEPAGKTAQLLLAVATIHSFLRDPPAADRHPWPGGYQQARSAKWQLAGQQHDVSWRWSAAGQFEFPDFDISAVLVKDNSAEDSLILEIEGVRKQFRFSRQGETLWLWEKALGNYSLEQTFGSGSAGDNNASGVCRSHGPGQVLRLLIKAGEAVSQGQALVVLESMKMESTLTAAVDGAVAEIAVEEGEVISSGQLLVRLDSSMEKSR